jgi:hypothetical protein
MTKLPSVASNSPPHDELAHRLPEPSNDVHNIASVRFPAEITARNRHADVPHLEQQDYRMSMTKLLLYSPISQITRSS